MTYGSLHRPLLEPTVDHLHKAKEMLAYLSRALGSTLPSVRAEGATRRCPAMTEQMNSSSHIYLALVTTLVPFFNNNGKPSTYAFSKV